VIEEGIEDLWDRFRQAVPAAQRAWLADFAKKFYSIPYAVKEYRELDELLDTIVTCLVYQHRMRVDYGGLYGDGKVHEFEPYTLAMFRGGLYLAIRHGKNALMRCGPFIRLHPCGLWPTS
jgi:hypothetical protein